MASVLGRKSRSLPQLPPSCELRGAGVVRVLRFLSDFLPGPGTMSGVFLRQPGRATLTLLVAPGTIGGIQGLLGCGHPNGALTCSASDGLRD